MPVRPLPNEGETKKVYRLYCDLLAEEGLSPAAGGEVRSKDPPDQHRQHRGAIVSHELARISWKSILNWVQHTEDLTEDFRKRSVVAALNRALQNWRNRLASPRQRRSGVSLPMLISWMWPNVTDEHITRMMEWICIIELEKFRQPTPPLMDAQDRQALESIFNTMDRHGKGSVLPEDIAGGKDQNVADKLKNIVDADTVKAVTGEGRITFLPFLELMCENGYLAHEGAKQVLLANGKTIVQQDRKAIGKKVWVFDGNPPEEEQPRRLADVFEAEVLRWRTVVEMSALKSLEDEAQAYEWRREEDEDEEEDVDEEEEDHPAMMDIAAAQTLLPES